jgi:hypothetical protein
MTSVARNKRTFVSWDGNAITSEMVGAFPQLKGGSGTEGAGQLGRSGAAKPAAANGIKPIGLPIETRNQGPNRRLMFYFGMFFVPFPGLGVAGHWMVPGRFLDQDPRSPK